MMQNKFCSYVVAACMSFGFYSTAFADNVRINAATFAKDPKKVKALSKAVAAMRARNTADPKSADFRTSWSYWANTHGYFGGGPNSSGPAADFKAQAPDICAGLTPASVFQTCVSYYQHVQDFQLPSDGITEAVWGMCQHSNPQDGPSQANLQFFTWHRMYLLFFERTLRKSSGDPKLTLPYWDYFAQSGPNKGIALPKIVRGTAVNPLFDQFRTPGLNNNSRSIPAGTGSAVQAFKFTDLRNFSFQLEMQPHGAMHCGAGFGCQAPDMDIVPVAGMDPVFYMHHANIDRLFQCWLNRKANGHKIDLAWAKANLGMDDAWFDQSYSFVDENGAAVSMKVADLFKPGVIDYHYDKESSCVPKSSVPKTPKKAILARTVQFKSAVRTEPVELKGETISVPLKAQPTDVRGAAVETPQAVKIEAGRVLLTVEDIAIKGSPGVTYEIWLSRVSAPTKAVYLATINYFGVIGPKHGHHAATDSAKPNDAQSIKLLYYDVTDELSQLGITGNNTGDVTVKFVSSAKRSSDIKAKAATAPSSKAGTVTIGKIRLQMSKE